MSDLICFSIDKMFKSPSLHFLRIYLYINHLGSTDFSLGTKVAETFSYQSNWIYLRIFSWFVIIRSLHVYIIQFKILYDCLRHYVVLSFNFYLTIFGFLTCLFVFPSYLILLQVTFSAQFYILSFLGISICLIKKLLPL